MGIVIDGYIAVSTKKMREHEHRDVIRPQLTTRIDGDRVGLWCDLCLVMLEQEPLPRTDLPCGCIDVASHNEDLAVQLDLRKKFRIPKSTCVGCYLGDDGISIHSCAIHPERYWPEAS